MSILINMEMPKGCVSCFLKYGSCSSIRKRIDESKCDKWCPVNYRHPDCPLIEVPEHGDLVDRDALMKEFEVAKRAMEQHGQEYSCSFLSGSQEISTEWYCVEDILDNAPTVIPVDYKI